LDLVPPRNRLTSRLRVVAALALLLLACADILAVDMFGQSGNTAPACSDGENHDEDCFCCCRHVIVTPQLAPQQIRQSQTVVTAELPAFESRPVAVPFHPPRS
jgi:hypothetical protein